MKCFGVSKTADDDEIKKAYRKLAKQYHPDSHQGSDSKAAEAKFKEISEAYSVLSDKQKRAQYDRFGSNFENAGFGGGASYSGGFGGFDFSGFGSSGGIDIDLDDILGSVFGGGFGGFGSSSSAKDTRPSKGADLRYNMTLSFEEAVFGCTKEINISRNEECNNCHGTGAKPGTSTITCSECNGKGKVQVVQNTIMGQFATVKTCDKCSGTGKIIQTPCEVCKGNKYIRKSKKIDIKIPAGIDNGQAVSLRGEGDVGKKGGPNGDLFVVVTVTPHKLFKRRNNDITYKVNIPFTIATLGGTISIPTLEGNIDFNIPEGTANNSVFKIKGKGIPSIHGNSRGDLEFTIDIDIPKKLNDKQKELLKEFASSMGQEVKNKKNIFGR
jgi:molecular chaperone DnaJ